MLMVITLKGRARKVAQLLGARAALPEDLASDPCRHKRLVTVKGPKCAENWSATVQDSQCSKGFRAM